MSILPPFENMARTKKQAQPKWKRNQAKKPQKQTESDGDAMETEGAVPADHEEIALGGVEQNEANEAGEDDGPKKLSLGKLKKKQRWEQKQLKVKVTNLKKER